MSVWKNAQASHSKPELEKVHFVWTIENFKFLGLKRNEYLESSSFVSSNYKWSLKLFQKEYQAGFDVVLDLKEGLQGQLQYDRNTRVKTIVKFYLLNTEDKVLDSFGNGIQQDLIIGGLALPSGFLIKDLHNGNEILQIGVEITIIKGKVETRAIPREIISNGLPIRSMCDMFDYSEFMNKKFLSDVEVIDANGKVFYGHKVILAKHSSVFAATFQHPMKENQRNQIIIDKFHPEVVAQMLNFIYTGKLELATITKPFEHIQELLSASDLYEIHELKTLCENLLIKNMSTDNVLILFVHGDTYRCATLKKAALNFIIAKKKSFFHFAEWIDFVGKYPQLTNEIFIKLAE